MDAAADPPEGMVGIDEWLASLRTHLGSLDEKLFIDQPERPLTNPPKGQPLLPPVVVVEEKAAKTKPKSTKKKGRGRKGKDKAKAMSTFKMPALLVLLTEESSAAGIWGFHERLASKSSARPPRYWRDGVRLLVSLLGLPPTTAAEEEYPDGPASSCSLATPSAMDLQRAPAVVTVIDEPWEPPPCECSEDVEDLIDRIGVLRREREYRDSALALVHGRAEWLWVASSGLFQPTGFITTKEKEALDKVAAYINQDGRCGRGSSSSSMSREEDFARPLGDFIKPVGSPPVYEVVPLDPLLSPSDWAVMVADDIENMVAKGCRSPIPVEAEIFFVCELSSLVIASYSPDDPSKDPVYGSALRLVWAIGCVLSIWVNLDDPNNYPFNAQVWSALGYISFRMGHYDIAV
ncbi:hypothetical protein FOZ62_016056 [Perkinsus olseni]|uniref:Uncharacterized protein n=1 Tax=Perkinsus olseni TaxID=32597 RepID=A0A7J6QCN3_PEROL|nr:hypothetical protein FOZ62_016056 [Perkinsus olseni]